MKLVDTAQVGPGDVLLIDRHPGEKWVAFLLNRHGTEVFLCTTAFCGVVRCSM